MTSILLPRRHHPRTLICPRHLKRICGTCVHFTGTLRTNGGCAAWPEDRSPLSSARDCDLWTRPLAKGDT